MGRRKQSRPHQSGGAILQAQASAGAELDKQKMLETGGQAKEDLGDVHNPYFVEVDRSSWLSNEHLDISEVVLTDLKLAESFSGFDLSEVFYQDLQYSLRFQLFNANHILSRIKLGHWPVVAYSDIQLEFVKRVMDHTETCTVMLSGVFDGPDEGVSGLIHLASLKFITLRPVLGIRFCEDMLSLRLRVEVLKNAFDACESLLDGSRQLWKKSMMNVMSWLRPEIMTSEVRYGVGSNMKVEVDPQSDIRDDTHHIRRHVRFDPAGFYEAIKPSKSEPMLQEVIPDLLPELRPYQRRAAFWMVEREKKRVGGQGERERSHFYSPLCVPVDFIDTSSKMYFNPFSGNISLCPEIHAPCVVGGILADEMGLGKTVELLACIFAHQRSASENDILIDSELQVNEDRKVNFNRLKRDRVECPCGAVSESLKYKGLWVQCDICDAWQHADCVGYSPEGKSLKSKQGSESKKFKTTIAVRDGEYICPICFELVQATESPIASGATLIVCPAPILSQWHDEISRHTHPGSLKTCVYEGVRETTFTNTSMVNISELASADIVLTTYDVLKEDLSHDYDRHEGDRHFLRFQKRYPVVPTLLTRIYWWRICLDEAQMVESNAAAATEMALRLNAKYRWCITGTPIQRKLDDLHGLLRFLKASPFDIYRWWADVIRDPYEKRDVGAMEFTHKIFKQIMWRSSKEHVANELQLPSQEECLTWLTLSPVEEHFYQRQHETCVNYAHEIIESLRNDILKISVPGSVSSDDFSDSFITHTEAGKLLNALLKLRQACCHPQVGSSGLRSLQQSPMTMEEILMVLISKTKIEGEEALRGSVVALNGLAAISIMQKDFSQAALLYIEALTLAEEHSEDFRLDPLLNIHIHRNLAEILPQTTNISLKLPCKGRQLSKTAQLKSKKHTLEKVDYCFAKKKKGNDSDDIYFNMASGELLNNTSSFSENDLNGHQEFDDASISSLQFLMAECEDLKHKYLSVFSSKLSAVQQEFQKVYLQVCNAYSESKNDPTIWWLEALDHSEQNKDFSNELLRKIEEAIAGTLNNSKPPRVTTRFRSIHSLKYQIQTGLDQLEASRKVLLDRILEIDQTMDKPKDEDIERVGKCRNCQPDSDGPPCILCELDELFQDYEARLFVLKNERGGIISSAEEAVDLQKKNSALNRFLSKLSQSNHISKTSDIGYEESKKRNVGERVVVSRSASQLEVILGVLKNYCKARLGRDSVSVAIKHLHIFEGMRKEFGHARSLALAQAQYLRAHDEIKMAVSRLHLKANENDKSLDALGENELCAASSNFSHDKFMSLASLSQIKGKLRYLKGLVQLKQQPLGHPESSSFTQEASAVSNFTEEKCVPASKADEDSCPVCQQKLGSQKMVFQCGHVTCCKCLFAMTEQRLQDRKFHKWVMCPTCRQHTDFGNIAYAVDRQHESFKTSVLQNVDSSEKCESSISVKGSYGTKIEAITKRILWIKSSDPKAKVLVFSSWNDVLDVLEHAFAANDITYIRMKGGRNCRVAEIFNFIRRRIPKCEGTGDTVLLTGIFILIMEKIKTNCILQIFRIIVRKSHVAISQFRGHQNDKKGTSQESTSKFIQVLLILIQHGANGLNLLEAQHVVLVEPLLNPAAEAQAISRVHRIGQKNKTLIHRFIVKDTVEESIYKLNRSRASHSVISGSTKNQDQSMLTLKDVETLLATAPLTIPESDENPTASLRHLPPSMAAAVAAEKRLNEQRA